MKFVDEHLSKRVFFAIIFASVFIALGGALPDLYFRYLDNTEYYTVSQPIPVNQKWFKPCDDTILTATRTSLVDTQANFAVDLVLKDVKGNRVLKIPNAHFTTDASVQKGEDVTISVVYKLPCDLADGLYFWQATMKYHVRGYEKFYTYISDTFNVNQYGVDPTVLKIATESANLKNIPPSRYQDIFTVKPSPTPIIIREESKPAGQSGEQTVIINNQQQPQPTPQPTPTPNNPNNVPDFVPLPSPALCVLGFCL